MKRFKQLFRHRPDEGQIGDCWRTCIGCLLDMPPCEVPHFVEGHWNDRIAADRSARAFLGAMGLDFVECAYRGDLDDVLLSVAATNPGKYYLLAGTSRTGVGHSVVCCDDGIVWDPSIDDAGIVGPMADGLYWVMWLVPSLLQRVPTEAGA